MSGPKVVSIVTREELVAAGQGLLARLDAAVQQWQRESAGNARPAEVQSTKDRRDALEAMLRGDRFAQFGEAVINEIDFLELDAVRRREQAAQARALERARASSGRELARTLLQGHYTMPEDVRQELSCAAAGRLTVAEMDAALSRARQAMFKQAAQSATAEQRSLANRLADQSSGMSLEEWKARVAKPDARLQGILSHLSELELLGETDEAATMSQQLSDVQAFEDDGVRQMRMDTLVFAVKKAKEAAAAKAKLVRAAVLLSAELSAFIPDSKTFAALHAAEAAGSGEQLEALIAQGQRELSDARTSSASAARRRAMLSGLQRMGYEVHEGLSTATSSSGRLVVRNPANNGYGVEVVSGASSEKVQVRSVAFGASRDATQDIPEEQRWCGDFGKLQAALRADGCEVVIEKALGVGTTPMKVLEEAEEERRRAAAAPSQAGRAR